MVGRCVLLLQADVLLLEPFLNSESILLVIPPSAATLVPASPFVDVPAGYGQLVGAHLQNPTDLVWATGFGGTCRSLPTDPLTTPPCVTGITFGLGWGVGTSLCKRLAPPQLASTMQGIFQGKLLALRTTHLFCSLFCLFLLVLCASLSAHCDFKNLPSAGMSIHCANAGFLPYLASYPRGITHPCWHPAQVAILGVAMALELWWEV
jgi:hypothetical protein